MGKIRLNSDYVKGQAEQLQNIENTLQNIAGEVNQCSANLRWNITSSERIRRQLGIYSQQTQKLSEKCNRLSVVLEEDVRLYSDLEKKLAGQAGAGTTVNSQKNNVTATAAGMTNMQFTDWIQQLFHQEDREGDYEIESVVFDDEGGYGGDQGSPQMQYGEDRIALYDIVRQYHPDWTDKEIQNYLRKLNSEGCGYVAIANTIFRQYEGKEKEFRKKFGFSMYKNGDLNYNELIVDFYAATDNHNKGWFWSDKVNDQEDPTDIEGWGTTPESQKYRAQLYLKEKNISVDVQTNKNITVDNYQKLAEKGSVIINYHYGNLYDADGNVVQYIDGGHSMTVTGVTEDGRYIVSSWGGKYYIDPNEMLNRDTSYDFVYYKYK